ncbi:hypothetical protein CPC08DRAFT_729339 [Agrocybe pediades]|nr:hypothetical protein CPC08DRAFT_729339 [Agrocybe pediades]
MPPKPKPKSKSQKNLEDTLERATLDSPVSSVSANPTTESPSKGKKRSAKTYKSPEVVVSDDDDEPVVVEHTFASKIPAVTLTKHKLKPGVSTVVTTDSDLDIDVVHREEYGFSIDDLDNSSGDDGNKSTEELVITDEEDIAEEDAKLVDGDTMYRGTSNTTARIRLKRSAPTTPPYGTRSSSTIQESPSRSPTKKARPDNLPSPKTPSPEKKSRKTAFPKANSANKDAAVALSSGHESISLGEDNDDPFIDIQPAAFNDTPVNGKKAKGSVIAATDKSADLLASVDDLDESDMPGGPAQSTANVPGERYHDDDRIIRVRALPKICEVSQPESQDEWLRKKGYYKNLPRLSAVSLCPLKASQSQGLVLFSKWREFIPSMTMVQLLKAILFVNSGRFINPSRIDPLAISGRPTTIWSDSRIELCTGGNVTAICVSPMMLIESYLHEFHPALSFSGHFVTGVLHSQEINRMVSLAGMLLKQDTINAQVWKDALTFGTKTMVQSKCL